MPTVDISNLITCTRTEFDALPVSQRFALLSSAIKSSTHVIRFHKSKQVWIVSFEAIVADWEPRHNGSGGRIRRPLKMEHGTLDGVLDKAVFFMIGSDFGKKVRWVV